MSTPIVMKTRRGPLEYAVSGEGKTVMCLHGAMGGWDQSMLLARTVGEPAYRYVAVSRPGYLGTPLDVGRTPEAQADLFVELLDGLGVERAGVMAVSGGGYSAIHFALRHPDRCWGLVLVSTTGGRVEGRMPLAFHMLRLFGRFAWFQRNMQRQMQRDPEANARRSIPDDAMRARTLADPEVGPLFRELQASTASDIGRRLPGTLNDVAITRSRDYPLEQVRVPTLVVHGTVDRLVPFARHGRVLAERIPGAQLVAAEGGDHVAIYTHHAFVKPRVVEFLRAHAPADSLQ